MKILAAAPDVARALVHCGGTLARTVAAGGEIVIVVPDSAAAIAALDGAFKVEELDRPDLDGRVRRTHLTELVRDFDPDLVIGPSPGAADTVSQSLAELLFSATYAATVPNFPVSSGIEPTAQRTAQFSYDDPVDARFHPQDFVDVTTWWDEKLQLLAACGVAPNDEWGIYARELSRLRGQQVQVKHAEAFRQIETWGRLRPRRLLPQ